MSKIWLSSDHHFKHEKILEYCSRPYKNTKEMGFDMIKKHNSLVSKEDTVFFLGDFCWSKFPRDVEVILEKMNGTKHLILGNHDEIPALDYVKIGFTSVHTSLIVDGFLLIHDPAVGGVIKDIKVIHGHTHVLGLRLAPHTYCVCVELHDYYPIEFQTIKDNW